MFHVKPADDSPGPAASALFGERLALAVRYVELLRDTGVSHGLIGPREGERLWSRHLLNCAVLAELVETGARVVDLGSGAGLPGIPLALARPDLEVVLLEPMARRVTWLRDTVAELGLSTTVARGRAEQREIRNEWRGADVVTARASAAEEVIRDEAMVRRFGGTRLRVVQCGTQHVDPPTMVVVVERSVSGPDGRRPRVVVDGGRSAGQASESDQERAGRFRRGRRQ
jgi:16S rRNA (guanine527-N7)-methyltransferase